MKEKPNECKPCDYDYKDDCSCGGCIKLKNEDKTCMNCKYRELLCSLPPCKDCELHFKWEPRDED